MEAAISSYSQARLSFSEQDLKDLEEAGKISGEIEGYEIALMPRHIEMMR